MHLTKTYITYINGYIWVETKPPVPLADKVVYAFAGSCPQQTSSYNVSTGSSIF